MSEEESKDAIFRLNNEYMSHSKKERFRLYEEYRQKRGEIREALKQGQEKEKNSKSK